MIQRALKFVLKSLASSKCLSLMVQSSTYLSQPAGCAQVNLLNYLFENLGRKKWYDSRDFRITESQNCLIWKRQDHKVQSLNQHC